MDQDDFVRCQFGQSPLKWAMLLIALLSITLLFAVQASFSPAIVQTADMIAIPP